MNQTLTRRERNSPGIFGGIRDIAGELKDQSLRGLIGWANIYVGAAKRAYDVVDAQETARKQSAGTIESMQKAAYKQGVELAPEIRKRVRAGEASEREQLWRDYQTERMWRTRMARMAREGFITPEEDVSEETIDAEYTVHSKENDAPIYQNGEVVGADQTGSTSTIYAPYTSLDSERMATDNSTQETIYSNEIKNQDMVGFRIDSQYIEDLEIGANLRKDIIKGQEEVIRNQEKQLENSEEQIRIYRELAEQNAAYPLVDEDEDIVLDPQAEVRGTKRSLLNRLTLGRFGK
jgi:hypothetical protein